MNERFDLAKVAALIERNAGKRCDQLLPTTRLQPDLDLDAVQVFRLVTDLESRFDISFPEEVIESLITADDIVYYVNVKLRQKASEINQEQPTEGASGER